MKKTSKHEEDTRTRFGSLVLSGVRSKFEQTTLVLIRKSMPEALEISTAGRAFPTLQRQQSSNGRSVLRRMILGLRGL